MSTTWVGPGHRGPHIKVQRTAVWESVNVIGCCFGWCCFPACCKCYAGVIKTFASGTQDIMLSKNMWNANSHVNNCESQESESLQTYRLNRFKVKHENTQTKCCQLSWKKWQGLINFLIGVVPPGPPDIATCSMYWSQSLVVQILPDPVVNVTFRKHGPWLPGP